MKNPLPQNQINRLRGHGIRHFDKLIHDQPKEWLMKYFSRGADEYPVNISMLMRNIIWQLRERIQKKEKPPLNELIRTFWYMYIKPTLSRAGSFSNKTDQYAQLVDVSALEPYLKRRTSKSHFPYPQNIPHRLRF